MAAQFKSSMAGGLPVFDMSLLQIQIVQLPSHHVKVLEKHNKNPKRYRIPVFEVRLTLNTFRLKYNHVLIWSSKSPNLNTIVKHCKDVKIAV